MATTQRTAVGRAGFIVASAFFAGLAVAILVVGQSAWEPLPESSFRIDEAAVEAERPPIEVADDLPPAAVLLAATPRCRNVSRSQTQRRPTPTPSSPRRCRRRGTERSATTSHTTPPRHRPRRTPILCPLPLGPQSSPCPKRSRRHRCQMSRPSFAPSSRDCSPTRPQSPSPRRPPVRILQRVLQRLCQATRGPIPTEPTGATLKPRSPSSLGLRHRPAVAGCLAGSSSGVVKLTARRPAPGPR
jgi:hypothetical protein